VYGSPERSADLRQMFYHACISPDRSQNVCVCGFCDGAAMNVEPTVAVFSPDYSTTYRRSAGLIGMEYRVR
jgi:hypothetical protein